MATTLQTLDRGIRALGIVARVGEISVSDLATELGIARAICYRIVTTLAEHGLVSRGQDRLVRLGGAVATLGSMYWPSLLRRSEMVLQELADLSGVTAHLSVMEGDELVVVRSIRPRSTDLRLALQVGHRYPVTAAPGWAVLALRPPSEGDAPEVREARRLGYSMSSSAIVEGIQGVSVGIAPVGQRYLPEASIGLVTVAGIDLSPTIPLVVAAASAVSHDRDEDLSSVPVTGLPITSVPADRPEVHPG
ncbi:MAG: IclR family transcriptional regulator [Beutenbergiaceae bacterium]